MLYSMSSLVLVLILLESTQAYRDHGPNDFKDQKLYKLGLRRSGPQDLMDLEGIITRAGKWPEFLSKLQQSSEKANGGVIKNWEQDAMKWADWLKEIQNKEMIEKHSTTLRPIMRIAQSAENPSPGFESYWTGNAVKQEQANSLGLDSMTQMMNHYGFRRSVKDPLAKLKKQWMYTDISEEEKKLRRLYGLRPKDEGDSNKNLNKVELQMKKEHKKYGAFLADPQHNPDPTLFQSNKQPNFQNGSPLPGTQAGSAAPRRNALSYQNGQTMGYQNGLEGYPNGPMGYQQGPPGGEEPSTDYQNGPGGNPNSPMRYQQGPPSDEAPPMGYQNGPEGYPKGPMGYQQGPPGGGGPPMGYRNGPGGNANGPMGYQQGPPGGGGPPMGYQYGPGGYSNDPMGYQQGPPGGGGPPMGYPNGPMGYQEGPPGDGGPPMGYQNGPGGYPNGPMGYQQGPPGGGGPPMGYPNGPMGYQEGPQGDGGPPMGYQNGPGGYPNSPMGYQQGPPGGGVLRMGYQNGPEGYPNGPMGYQQGPPGGGGPPMGYRNGPGGNANGPMRYQQGPPGGGGPPMGYQYGPGGYSNDPMGYQQGPPGGGGPPMGYPNGPMGYQEGPLGDGGPPMGYQNGPGGYPNGPMQYQQGPPGGGAIGNQDYSGQQGQENNQPSGPPANEKPVLRANPESDPLPEPVTNLPTTQRPTTKDPLASYNLPEVDDYLSPIRWVKFNSIQIVEDLAKVTDPDTGNNRQFEINGTLYVPIIDSTRVNGGKISPDLMKPKKKVTAAIRRVQDDDMTALNHRFKGLNRHIDWMEKEYMSDPHLEHSMRPEQCEEEGCNARCNNQNCKTRCYGDTCSAGCASKFCEAHCEGPGCKAMCLGEQCTALCNGLACDARCIGLKCVTKCVSKASNKSSDNGIQYNTFKFPLNHLISHKLLLIKTNSTHKVDRGRGNQHDLSVEKKNIEIILPDVIPSDSLSNLHNKKSNVGIERRSGGMEYAGLEYMEQDGSFDDNDNEITGDFIFKSKTLEDGQLANNFGLQGELYEYKDFTNGML